MLITCRIKNNTPYFQVCKEGLLKLRDLRNHKLRIVFNISESLTDIEHFNNQFVDNGQQFSHIGDRATLKTDEYATFVRVGSSMKYLSEGRVLVTIDLVRQEKSIECTSPLMVLGYLTASVFFYHSQHEQEFAEGALTQILSKLCDLLRNTQIEKLEEQIKYKSGFAKKPFLMCLLKGDGEDQALRTNFRDFYRYRENQHQFNKAVDALLDYFPERSAVSVAGPHKVKKLSQQFASNILGRQIFNFEITGTTLENLCFELVEIYNSNCPVDLVGLYRKIINNQKTRVFDCSIQQYLNLVSNLKSQLPLCPHSFQSLHNEIESETMQDTLINACNCMDLLEYSKVHQQLLTVISKKSNQLQSENMQKLRDKYNHYYQLFQATEDISEYLAGIDSSNIYKIIQYFTDKFSLFCEQVFPDYNLKTIALRLIENFHEVLSCALASDLEDKQRKMEHLQQQVKTLEEANKLLQVKCKALEQQYLYTSDINNEFKSKLLGLNLNQEKGDCDFTSLNKKIKELEQEIIDKDIYIDDLTAVLQKFDIDFNRKYFKPKFSAEVHTYLTELTHKIRDVYKVFDELRKIEGYYAQVKEEFEQQKNKIENERLEDKKKIVSLDAQLSKAVRENNKLNEVINEARAAIHVMKTLEETYKSSIDEKEIMQARISCLKHEAEGQLDEYKKVLQLVGQSAKNCRSDDLKKYMKVTEIEELKEFIEVILKR